MERTPNNYKQWHKPVMNENSKFHQGYFIPTNPDKCLTKTNIYRSSWEFKVYSWLDRNPAIKRWASEPIAIKYVNPVKNITRNKTAGLNNTDPRNHSISNYYTDIWFEIEDAQGNTVKIFGEIKPYAQTLKPKPVPDTAKLKDIKRYNRECETWLVNQAKWAAAIKFCNEMGCKFIIITEKTLNKIGLV